MQRAARGRIHLVRKRGRFPTAVLFAMSYLGITVGTCGNCWRCRVRSALHIRPLSVSIPFHVGLVTPELRAPNPLLPAFVDSLQKAAAELQARLRAASRGR